MSITIQSHHLRVHAPLGITATSTPIAYVIEYVAKMCRTYAYVREHGNREHYHFWCVPGESNLTRYYLRTLCGTGNGNYSYTVCRNPTKLLAYMMKTGAVEYVNVDPNLVKDAQVYNAKVQDEITEKKEAKKKPLWRTIMDYIDDQYAPSFSDHTVARLVIQYHKDHDRPIREFQLLSITQTILLHRDPSYINKLENQIVDRLNKN